MGKENKRMKKSGARIVSVANAGILIVSGEHKILVDGLFNKAPKGFSSMSEEKKNLLLEGRAPYDNITEVLITHFHIDHFDIGTVLEFAKRNHPRVFMPESARFEKKLAGRAENEVIMTRKGVRSVFTLDADNHIEAFAIEHSGRTFRDMMILCYICVLNGKRVLILSDADFNPEYIAEMAGDQDYDVIVANPLFFDIPDGRETILKRLRSKAICVYHLPYEGDDLYGIREMALRETRLYAPEGKVFFMDKPNAYFDF